MLQLNKLTSRGLLSASASAHPRRLAALTQVTRNHHQSASIVDAKGQTGKDAHMSSQTAALMDTLRRRDGHKKEFIQCAEEILESLSPLFDRNPSYIPVMERLLEPERVIQFRVAWVDDKGAQHINRGWRVQYSSAIGPFKGGLRFHPSASASIFEFLGLEQVLKNALTGLAMGGGKGGSDFDPKGKSDNEIMRFCHAFMIELHNYIGGSQDVPAGDIGVGGREIGYMFGMYRKLTTSFDAGVLTGKNISWGGSYLRPEATGYGVVYFAEEAVKQLKKDSLFGKRCVISGSGNVALHCAAKLMQHGAVPVTLSDSNGYIIEPEGFTLEQLKQIMHIKEVKRERIEAYTKVSKTAKYFPGQKPWSVKCDYAFPSATQNELDEQDAKVLVANGCQGVFEGANMPSSNEAIKLMKDSGLIFGPSKACNAGGVAVSGLEMAQNSMRQQWTIEEIDHKLKNIMREILTQCASTAKEYGREGDLQFGANIAGFLKVAGAMKDQGIL